MLRHPDHVQVRGDDMTGMQSGTLVEKAPTHLEKQEVRLSLPEATMFIVASSGVLCSVPSTRCSASGAATSSTSSYADECALKPETLWAALVEI